MVLQLFAPIRPTIDDGSTVSDSGIAKILDFGLAKLAERADGSDPDAKTVRAGSEVTFDGRFWGDHRGWERSVMNFKTADVAGLRIFYRENGYE